MLLVYYGLDRKIIGCNSKFCEMAGGCKNDLKGKPVNSVLCKEKSDDMEFNDMELLKSGEPELFECNIGMPPHSYIVSKNIFHNQLGEPGGILCVMTDVSDLKEAHLEIMEAKMRELTSNALRLVQMSEINNRIIDELERLIPYADPTGKKMIRSMISNFSIKSGDNLWSEFEMRFGSVNESFYKVLNEKFPELTPNEKKLCALLKLNLSSKDIAAITLQNPQSVDVARYRLRKKIKSCR
jgi:hypothetical protein